MRWYWAWVAIAWARDMTSFDVPAGVVVGVDGLGDVLARAGGGQILGGGEDRITRVIGVGHAVAVDRDPVLGPRGGLELHPADGAGAGGVEVLAVVGLDGVDRRQHLPRHAVLVAGLHVDGDEERGRPVAVGEQSGEVVDGAGERRVGGDGARPALGHREPGRGGGQRGHRVGRGGGGRRGLRRDGRPATPVVAGAVLGRRALRRPGGGAGRGLPDRGLPGRGLAGRGRRGLPAVGAPLVVLGGTPTVMVAPCGPVSVIEGGGVRPGGPLAGRHRAAQPQRRHGVPGDRCRGVGERALGGARGAGGDGMSLRGLGTGGAATAWRRDG